MKENILALLSQIVRRLAILVITRLLTWLSLKLASLIRREMKNNNVENVLASVKTHAQKRKKRRDSLSHRINSDYES